MKLYNIYVEDSYGNKTCYQATTNDFDKWFKNHNENRIADGEEPETKDCFMVEDAYLELFND